MMNSSCKCRFDALFMGDGLYRTVYVAGVDSSLKLIFRTVNIYVLLNIR